MTTPRYLNFDLWIEPSRKGDKEGYLARVDSPAGQASNYFEPAFTELEVENFVLRLGRTRGRTRGSRSGDMEASKAFGGRLFAAVFGGGLDALLRSSLDEAQRKAAGLRLRLRLTGAPELLDLPWEYLYNEPLNRFLSLSVSSPIVRYLEIPERIEPLAVAPPIRLLGMISSPTDLLELDVEREWAKLLEALEPLRKRGLIELERIPDATLPRLQQWLRQGEFHVFHFIGHGGFNEATGEGLLVLEDEQRAGREVGAESLGRLLHDEPSLRLVVLNACEGGRSSLTDPFAGTAQGLIQQGIPAVVAMQFEISDEAAITLAHRLYETLAEGYPVDAALAEARKALSIERESDIEWGTPVLYMRSPDGRLFDVAPPSTQATRPTQAAPPALVQPSLPTGATSTTAQPGLPTENSVAASTTRQHPKRRALIAGIAGLALMVGLLLFYLLAREPAEVPDSESNMVEKSMAAPQPDLGTESNTVERTVAAPQPDPDTESDMVERSMAAGQPDVGTENNTVERTMAAPQPDLDPAALWEKNWLKINEPHGSGCRDAESWTNREQFLAILGALDLSSDQALEQQRAELEAHVALQRTTGTSDCNLPYTGAMQRLESVLKRGIRSRAIKNGVDVGSRGS